MRPHPDTGSQHSKEVRLCASADLCAGNQCVLVAPPFFDCIRPSDRSRDRVAVVRSILFDRAILPGGGYAAAGISARA